MKPLIKKALFLMLFVCVTQPGWAASKPANQPPTIVVVGDSLSAAYGLKREQGWVALLDDKLEDEGYPHTLLNASISGETTAGGLRRLPDLLDKHAPEIVIIELGGNDGLRALSIETMRANLQKMVELSQAAQAHVLLLGMRIPSNYGPAYTESFHAVFGEVAAERGTALVDFFLDPVALKPQYFQSDRIHPKASAQPLMLEHVWPTLGPLLDKSLVQ